MASANHPIIMNLTYFLVTATVLVGLGEAHNSVIVSASRDHPPKVEYGSIYLEKDGEILAGGRVRLLHPHGPAYEPPRNGHTLHSLHINPKKVADYLRNSNKFTMCKTTREKLVRGQDTRTVEEKAYDTQVVVDRCAIDAVVSAFCTNGKHVKLDPGRGRELFDEEHLCAEPSFDRGMLEAINTKGSVKGCWAST